MFLFFGCVDHKFLNAQMYSVTSVEFPQMCFLLLQESPILCFYTFVVLIKTILNPQTVYNSNTQSSLWSFLKYDSFCCFTRSSLCCRESFWRFHLQEGEGREGRWGLGERGREKGSISNGAHDNLEVF